MEKNEIIRFNDGDFSLEVKLNKGQETVWITQAEMSELFESSINNIGEHIQNIYQIEELYEKDTVKLIEILRLEGKRNVRRSIQHYNLDMIISVGYRVQSKRATSFRKWATDIIKKYTLEGYVVNKNMISTEQQLQLIRLLGRVSTDVMSNEILSILEQYTFGLQTLDDYDHQNISKPEGSLSNYKLSYDEAIQIVNTMRENHNTDVFGIERGGAFKSSLGAIYQTYDGVDVYLSVEEKASNLLYFLVKNHGFTDGNKRIAAALFIYFLDKNNILFKEGIQVINNKTLAALTIMLAESNPNEKELLVNLIMTFLIV